MAKQKASKPIYVPVYVAVYTRINRAHAWKFERVTERGIAESDAKIAQQFGTSTRLIGVESFIPKFVQ